MQALQQHTESLSIAQAKSQIAHQGLHKHWRALAETDKYCFGETQLLLWIAEYQPDLIPIATGIEKSRNGRFFTSTVNCAAMEEVCFHWRLWMYCKYNPGCIAPPSTRAMFEGEHR